MLNQIWIKNFALIKELVFEFKKGFTVITGETGSGKSIFLGALNLILGERADFKLIGPHGDKTFVEAEFKLDKIRFLPWFEKADIDFLETCIVRREINSQGRSRAFINDTPVGLGVLKSLCEQLVFIHSQHHTLALRDKQFQLGFLDSMADNDSLLKEFNVKLGEYQLLKKEIDQRRVQIDHAESEKEFALFQLKEIESLDLEINDFTELESELNLQENLDSLLTTLSEIYNEIESESGVRQKLSSLKSSIDKSSVKNEKIEKLNERINSSSLELTDIAEEAHSLSESLEKSPERLQQLTNLVDNYNTVLIKHRCLNQDALLAKVKNWKEIISLSTDGMEELEAMNIELDKLNSLIEKQALEISARRKKVSIQVQPLIVQMLSDLKMANTKIYFEFKTATRNSLGIDEMNLLFSPNSGLPLQEIEKVASGGELSRLMLVIQCLISEKKKLPTILFDEIDTGISGDVAQKMGELLQRMGENMQLLTITHLPQVAAKGENHILVLKALEDDITTTKLTELSNEERLTEVARLLSGENINEAALANAKELMS
ncbi:MAG: DNA repair protein RecN (Recombination protein N) [Lentimonas sp.]|jgi:DNA repair protein RecN (Recombination protein N)